MPVVQKKWFRVTALVVTSVVPSVLAFLALSLPWYHVHEAIYLEDDYRIIQEEYVFFLDKYTVDYGSTSYTYGYHQVSNFWVPLEPMNSFMATIGTLLQFCIALPLIAAVLALSKSDKIHLVFSAASAGILASVPIAFFLGFVDAYNETDLMRVYGELHSFIGDKTSETAHITREVWGPLSAWWLMVVACAIQIAGLVLAHKFRKAKAV